jgi:hypothetical protein
MALLRLPLAAQANYTAHTSRFPPQESGWKRERTMDWLAVSVPAVAVAVLSAAVGAAVGSVVEVLLERWLKKRFGR